MTTIPDTTYLVTGGAGFIGSTIVRRLLAEQPGAHVRVLDNFSTGRRENLADLSTGSPLPFFARPRLAGRIELIEGDLRDANIVAHAVNGVDYVIHQAAQISVPRSVEAPEETDAINTQGTLGLLHAAHKAEVRRVVIASTCAVYGDNPALPLDERAETRPLSPYAASKLATEGYASVFTRTYGLPVVALRYFNVYGPRQDPASPYAAAIPIFISRLLAGRRPTVFGDGLQTRDFVFVEDVVRANLRALSDEVPAGEVFNIGSGTRVSVLELLQALNQVLGTNLEPEFAPPRPGDIRHSGADVRKAAERMGWTPLVSLLEGLHHTATWFRDHGSLP